MGTSGMPTNVEDLQHMDGSLTERDPDMTLGDNPHLQHRLGNLGPEIAMQNMQK